MLEAKLILSAHLPFSLFSPKSTDGSQKLNLPNVEARAGLILNHKLIMSSNGEGKTKLLICRILHIEPESYPRLPFS